MLRKLVLIALLTAFGMATFGCASTSSPNQLKGDNAPRQVNDKGRVI